MSKRRQEASETSAAGGTEARGYETRDVQLKWIVYFGLALAVAGVFIHVGLWLLVDSFSAEAKRRDPVVSPLADRQQEPPPPQLQAQPALDYRQYQREQLNRLEHYGWVDRGRGVVRIPIDRAIDLLLERGLPPTPVAAAASKPSRREDDRPKSERQTTTPKGRASTP